MLYLVFLNHCLEFKLEKCICIICIKSPWSSSKHQSHLLLHFKLAYASMFNFENLAILCAWIAHLSQKLWAYDFSDSFRCSNLRVSLCYWPKSNIRVKSYGRLNLPCASMFNFDHLDILCAWIGRPSEKLWPYEFADSFCCSKLSVSICYWPKSKIRVKIYGRLNLSCASLFNFEHLDIFCTWVGLPSEKL